MKRLEPSKDKTEELKVEIYKQHLNHVGSFSDDENENETEEKGMIEKTEMTGIEDATTLLGDTMEVYQSLHDYYYNGDWSLKSIPIVLIHQMYTFQVLQMSDELNELKKTELHELLVDVGTDYIGIAKKYEYINHLLIHYNNEEDTEIIHKLIDHVKQSNGSYLLPKTLFTPKEQLYLVRKGLLIKKKAKKTSIENLCLLYPHRYEYVHQLPQWRKKVLNSISSSPFHTILKSVCFLSSIILL